MAMVIHPLKVFGCLTVYERDRKGETTVPKYFVMNNQTQRILEEFRRKDRAMKWAKENYKQRPPYFSHPARPISEVLQELVDHPDVQDVGLSILLDEAPDWPIVLTKTTEEMVQAGNNARCDGDPPYRFQVGQVRFEVSDDLPNKRGDSFDHDDFGEAMQTALHWQGRTAASKVKLRG